MLLYGISECHILCSVDTNTENYIKLLFATIISSSIKHLTILLFMDHICLYYGKKVLSAVVLKSFTKMNFQVITDFFLNDNNSIIVH